MVDGDAVPGMGRGLVAHLWPDRSLFDMLNSTC
jgi:hypothetical protein